jgi:hypothetical protein
MKSKFYEIKNKVVTNINIIPFNNYLKKHNFQAPPIPFGVKTIKRNIFNKIEKIEKYFYLQQYQVLMLTALRNLKI